MQRITISLDETLATAFDEMAATQGYQSRSEALRDVVRNAVEAQRLERRDGDCVANLSYVYSHEVRALAQRLVDIGHEHHDLVVATTHVHLDHENCLESMMLKGSTVKVRALANAIRAERGVRFGELNLVSVSPAGAHTHGEGSPHEHLTPAQG